MGKSAVTIWKWGIKLIQYGLSSSKRPHPISDLLSLTFWVVAYGRFDRIAIANGRAGEPVDFVFDVPIRPLGLACNQSLVSFAFAESRA